MSTLVDTDERELRRLPHLPVRNTIARLDVDEAGDVVVLGGDDIRDGLPAEPVAVVIRVAEVQRDADIPPQQRADVLDRIHAPVIVARRPERRANGIVRLGEVDVRADGLLDGGRVEVVDVEGVGEGVGGQLAEVVFVAAGVDVVQVLDLLVAEVVGGAADLVEAGRVARKRLVVAVAFAVEVVVPHVGDSVVEGLVVVRVAGRDGEVVVGLVLRQRVEPAVADEDGLQVNLNGVGDVLAVLLLDVLAEDGRVVAAVALGGEVEAVLRVLGEGAHEALQRLPEVGGCVVGRVGGQGQVRVRVRAAVGGVVGACGVRQSDDVALLRRVRRHGDRVGEADLRGLVDEELFRCKYAGINSEVFEIMQGLSEADNP